MSNRRHRRQPLPVVAVGKKGGDQYYGRLSCNESANNNFNSGTKKSTDDEYDDDDDQEDALRMSYIFSRRTDDPKRKRKAMSSIGGKLTEEEARAVNFDVPPKPNMNNDEAERVARQKPIPSDITSITQLKWHCTKTVSISRNGNGVAMPSTSTKLNSRETHLMPCFVLSREKAASYRRKKMGTTEQRGKATNDILVQYLSLQNPNRGECKYVQESTLIPFGVEDGSSSCFHDAYLQRYIAQEIKQSAGPEEPMRIMQIYLKRVFDTVWNMEAKEREQAQNELQDYYDEDEELGVSSSKRGGNKKQAKKKKQAKVLELDDDDNDSDDDDDDDHDDTNIFQECSDQDDADDMDDLDAPYTQAITFDPDDFRMDDEGISNEPIRPGDVIEYYSPIYVAGDPRGLRRATVLSIDPKDSMPLVLSNGEGLPKNVKVKRIKVMSGDDLLDHPGIFRLICMFKLRKLGSATAADGIAMETTRFRSIMKKNISKMKEMAEDDGFAPMDFLVKMKGVNDNVHGTRTKKEVKVSGSSSSRKIESGSMSFTSSSDSSSGSSSDEEIAKIRSRRMVPKQISSVDQRKLDSKNKGGTAEMNQKGKVGSFLMSKSLSDESDDSSNTSISVMRSPKERNAGTKSRDGLDLSLSSDDDSTLSNLRPGSIVRNRSTSRLMKRQENAASKLDYELTPEPTAYPVQALSKTISKSTVKKRTSPLSSSSSSEDSDIELNILSKPFRIHNKNAAKCMKPMSGTATHSSESIKRRCESEERTNDAEERPTSSHETFGWTKESAGWKKISADGSGFSFARFK